MMMTVNTLQRFYEYERWVTNRLASAISRLTADEFRRVISGGHGSIRGTVVHLVSAEWGWMERCGGPARGPRLNPESYETAEAIVEVASAVQLKMANFLTQLSDADLARKIEFGFAPTESHVLRVDQLLEHAFIHGVHHRGQLALLLRLLQHAPGDFDLLYYDIATNDRRQTSPA